MEREPLSQGERVMEREPLSQGERVMEREPLSLSPLGRGQGEGS